MATLLQFLGRPHSLVKRVIVVAGKSSALRDVAIETVAEATDTQVDRIDAASTEIRQFLSHLAMPSLFQRRRLVVYGDLTSNHQYLDRLPALVEHPPAKTYVILTAQEIRRQDGQRWIPSTSSVLYIDCSHPTVSQTSSLIQRYGLTESSASWLIERCQGSIYDIFRIIDLLHVFPKPWSLELVQSITPSSDPAMETFEQYAVMPASDQSICRQLRRRIVQLTELSSLVNSQTRMTALELASRIDAEPFIVAKLFPLAREHTPDYWLPKLQAVITATEYASLGMPGVRQFLTAKLTTDTASR
jgi:hypothetical protein